MSNPDPLVIEVNDDTVILEGAYEHRPVPPSAHSRFGDDVWRLPPHILDIAGQLETITWGRFPQAFRTPVKLFMVALLRRLPPLEMIERYSNARSVITPTTMVHLARHLAHFPVWLVDRGVSCFEEVDEALMSKYADFVTSQARVSAATQYLRLWALTRLWLYRQYLPESDRLCRPPWESPEGPRLRDIVGSDPTPGENTTAPIDPDTIGIFFKWCEWLILEASDDIERALARRDEFLAGLREQTGPGDSERWREYLDELRATGRALPGRPHETGAGLARKYVAAEVGVGLEVVQRPHDIPVELGAPLRIEITGQMAGAPWTDDIDFYEVDQLERNLVTACLFTIAYITGMRGKEVRALERGCCHRIDRGEGLPAGYEIHGRKFKATGSDGNYVPGGQERDMPWPGIVPVPQAVAIMERLHGSNLLFPHAAFVHGRYRGRAPSTDVAVSKQALNYALDKLVEWCDATALQRGLPEAVIPVDPLGKITIERLRRTMAWFVFHKPYGRLSLGTLFEHVGFHVTDGYGTQIFTGQRTPYAMEEASSVIERLASAAALLESGERVSGKGARRLLDACSVLGQFEGTHLENDELVALIAESGGVDIIGNPYLQLHCHYVPELAECHPEHLRNQPRPNLGGCQRECACVVYTDSDSAAMSGEIRMLRAEAVTPGTPLPRAVRCTQRADHLQKIVDAHERNRIGLKREET
jgi:hypothetical protein